MGLIKKPIKALNNKIQRNKIFLKLSVILSIIFLTIAIFIIHMNLSNGFHEIKTAVNDEAKTFKSHINERVLNNQLFLQGFDDNLKFLNQESTNRDLEYITNEIKFIENNTIYNVIYYIDFSRNIMLTNNKIEIYNSIDEYFNESDWYEASIQYRRAQISNIINDPESNQLFVGVSLPIIENNKVIGIITGKININDFERNKMFNYQYNELFNYSIVDSDNNQIFYYGANNDDYLNKNLLEKKIFNLYNSDLETNYTHLYDGRVFNYWKYKVNINYRIFKNNMIDNINEIIALLIIFYLITVLFLWIVFKKYKKTILLDMKYNFKKQISKIKTVDLQNNLHLVFVDIEKFSIINEMYGFEVGNDILVQTAKQLLHYSKDKTFEFIYLGSDNFLLIYQFSSWTEAKGYFNNFIEKLSKFTIKKNNGNGKTIDVKFNFILYEFISYKYEINRLEEHIDKIHRLLNIVFKKINTNFLIYRDIYDVEKIYEEHEEVKEFLLEVIKNKSLEPFMQPIINLKKNTIASYEILMRIIDDDIYLSPYPFIKISERYNLIKQLDYILIEKTLEKLTDLNWSPKISFNISIIELNSDNHLMRVIKLINKYGYKKSKITFEITETNIIEDFILVLNNIKLLKEHNFKISLDDFGTGFSNLQTLSMLKKKCDFIKIDGSFIKNLSENEEEQYIVNAIVNLAKAYKIEVVAEFVEDQKIQEILQEMNVDYGQGYLYSKPNEIEKIYKESSED